MPELKTVDESGRGKKFLKVMLPIVPVMGFIIYFLPYYMFAGVAIGPGPAAINAIYGGIVAAILATILAVGAYFAYVKLTNQSA